MKRLIVIGLLTAGALLSAFPFIYMLSTSLKSLQEAAAPEFHLLPQKFLWSNYVQTFDAAPFARYFANTFFVAGIVTLSVVVTAIAGGYALAKLTFPGWRLPQNRSPHVGQQIYECRI